MTTRAFPAQQPERVPQTADVVSWFSDYGKPIRLCRRCFK